MGLTFKVEGGYLFGRLQAEKYLQKRYPLLFHRKTLNTIGSIDRFLSGLIDTVAFRAVDISG
jgi:hypothetical protein